MNLRVGDMVVSAEGDMPRKVTHIVPAIDTGTPLLYLDDGRGPLLAEEFWAVMKVSEMKFQDVQPGMAFSTTIAGSRGEFIKLASVNPNIVNVSSWRAGVMHLDTEVVVMGKLTVQPEVSMDASLLTLGLCYRVRFCLERAGIKNVSDLVKRSAEDLLDQRNFGEASLLHVRQKLREYGLTLREEL